MPPAFDAGKGELCSASIKVMHQAFNLGKTGRYRRGVQRML